MSDLFSSFEKNLMVSLIEMGKPFQGVSKPNPVVVAAIYRGEDVISYGIHDHVGGDHAEIKAINQSSHQDIKGASMMVTLEPCTHYGKTPPCTKIVLPSCLATDFPLLAVSIISIFSIKTGSLLLCLPIGQK